MRRTSLDELPQLWNVLKGEMSLVGPRPVMAYERPRFEAWHLERELMRPGISGLWQVSGRDRLSALEMLALDVEYVRRQSLQLDLQILALTIPAVLGGLRRGAVQAPAARLAAAASPVASEVVSPSTTPR
jgi:lipopolysaccharide/colanic/teichoic acid biosynthesis glycosyltransferase